MAGYYLEENGIVKVQFEDVANGANPPAGWVYQNAANGNNGGFEGDGYYYWKSQTSTSLDSVANQGLISVDVYIQEAGTYNLFLRSARDSNTPSDARNDIWVTIDDGIVPLLVTTKPMVTSNGFVKLYGASTGWSHSRNFDDQNTDNNPASQVVLSEGLHTITFAGRSQGYHIDSFQLTKGSNPNTTLVTSQFVPDGEPEPEPAGTGTAVLEVTLNGGIQKSNFDANSFKVTNTGDKDIAKVEIDVTGALFPDTVFDPFGVAGDTVSKALTINTNGSTGVVSPSSSSYIGTGGADGFEKIQILFNSGTNGGFNPGETLGFSIDMDPNSIAGAEKTPLDNGSDPTWDVGGVSGAELIGSTFTVTFTDGTTATGQLQGHIKADGTPDQSGAQALATQAAPAGAVELTVNGLVPGESGTYSGAPQVFVDGPAGQVARIVLAKGFIQPGENLFSEPYASQLDAQLGELALSPFPANNAVEFQVVDVPLTGAPLDVTSLFDFDGVPVAGVADPDQLALGFMAGIVDPANDDLPIGPVTEAVYLTHSEATGSDGIFINAGGGSYTTAGGVTYLADTYFTGGKVKVAPNAIAGTGDDQLYQEYRFNNANFGYAIPVANGTYEVDLSFAETYSQTPGARVFDVTAEGLVVLDNLEVLAEAGFATAYTAPTITVTVTDGVLDLGFVKGSSGNPMIQALAVRPADGSAPTNQAPQATDDGYGTGFETALSVDAAQGLLDNDSDADGGTLAVTAVNGTGPVGAPVGLASGATVTVNADGSFAYSPAAGFSGDDTFQYTVADGQGGTATATATIAVASAPGEPAQGIFINAGGGAYVSTDGVSYLADAYFTGGQTFSTASTINNTDDVTLFQSERWGVFGYDIPVTNGTYEVSLDFAEIYFDASGKRVFDVLVEGVLVLDDLDIWAAAGGKNVAYSAPTITIAVTDGVLDIDFEKGIENPKVSAIGVVPVTIGAAPPVAGDDGYATLSGDTLSVGPGSGLLFNDRDANGDQLTVTAVNGADDVGQAIELASGATLTVNSDGSFAYAPAPGFSGDDTFQYTVSDGQGGTDTATATINVVGQAPDFELYINAGGGSHTTAEGLTYVADTDFVSGKTKTAVVPITGTAEDPLYHAYRFNNFGYDIELANGVYEIDLSFAETYSQTPGARVFDVLAEGKVVLNNLEVLSAAGGFATAYTAPTITVTVIDGVLDLDFENITGNAMVSAIGIRNAVLNDAPIATGEPYQVDEDGTLTVAAAGGVLANDSDPDLDPLTATLLTQASNGSVVLQPDGAFTYVPAANFNGTDSFTYEVVDDDGATATATATITVNPVSDAPVAVANGYVTPVDTGLAIGGAGVLGNDSDADGDTINVSSVNGSTGNVGTAITLAEGGTLTLDADGTFVYAPAPGYVGLEKFTYTVSDGALASAEATVTIDVTTSLPPEVTTNAGLAVDEGGSVAFDAAALEATDPDTAPENLVYTVTSLPEHGILKWDGSALSAGSTFTQAMIATGLLIYEHDGSETTADGFGFEVSDGIFTIPGQSLAVTVTPVSDPPVAAPDNYATAYETALTVAAGSGVLDNDTDVDDATLTVSQVEGVPVGGGITVGLASGATVTMSADGGFVYTPAAGFSGEDSFTYTARDAAGNEAEATVAVDVAEEQPAFELHINSGGGAYTTVNGVNFVADTGFVGGSTFATTGAISGTQDDPLYQTERWGAFSYSIAVEPGAYSVGLDFAEQFWNAAGQRVFDVLIEGQLAFNDLDIWLEAGGKNAAFDPPPISVDVTDGSLDIQFVSAGADNPKVNAVSIVSLGANAGNAPTAVNDLAAAPVGTSVDIDVLDNDTDFDGDTLEILSVTQGTLGSVAINDAGTPGDTGDDFLTYTAAGQAGTDTFTYTIGDGTGKTATASVEVEVQGLDEIAFTKVALTGIPNKSYTSLQFGPDGKLYASHRFGDLYAFEIEEQTDATGKVTGYHATSVETISILKTLPNHNDDGSLAPDVTNRQVTGIAVGGTSENPVIYAVSSDPREGGGDGGSNKGDTGLDTNSGVLSRLTWNGSSWDKLDLVRGLPRSEENHSTNGLLLTTDPDTGDKILLAAQGGHTNAGAPSKNFAYGSEYALSAAILKINLTDLESGTGDYAVKTDGAHKYVYDLPTVGGVSVFGGQDGKNQARLVDGPVTVFSSGWRNPYDIVQTESGDIFSIDNGANQGWGGLPEGEGTANVTDKIPPAGSDPDGFNSVNNLDHLEWIPQEGYYAGHPNPIRANSGAGLTYTDANGQEVWSQNPGGAWPPVDYQTFSFPDDDDFLLPGVDDNALVTWGVSTNGLAEYTSGAFQGAMKGNLIAAAFDSSIYRIIVEPGKTGATKEAIASGLPGTPLDVIAQGDNDPFPGTIWIGYVAGGAEIEVLVPTFVTGSIDDFDGDGYLNDDEIANDTNPNSPSSVPPDNDGDFVSDLNDQDDDEDGLLDPADHFALDATNGTGLVFAADVMNEGEPNERAVFGFLNPLRNDDPGTGFAGLGFTGWMSNGTTDYLDQFDPDNLIPGGTSGIFTIINTTSGDARGALNTLDNGFQFGITPDTSQPFLVQASLLNVFQPLEAGDLVSGQFVGIQVGSGDQDNYVKLAVGVDIAGDLGIVLLHEEGGSIEQETFLASTPIAIGSEVQLYFEVDAAAGTVTPGWQIDGGAGQTGSAIAVGGDILAAIQGTYQNGGEDSAMAVGVMSSSGPTGESFAAQYDYIDLFQGTLVDEFAIA